MNLLLGADPELFVRKDGKFFSAHTLIPGTKKKPFKVEFGAVQKDGVAAEFNIDPAKDRYEFLWHIRAVMGTLRIMIGEDYELVAVPTAVFDREYFDSLPDIPKELGCTPDYNAYTMRMNKSPVTNEPFRTGAGHIHLGFDSFRDSDDPEIFIENCRIVKQLDSVLFFASLLWDNDEKRRELYGNIGAFRSKRYGLEYRPMSNAWLNDDELILWVYDAARKAVELFFEGKKIYETACFDAILNDYLAKDLSHETINSYNIFLETVYDIPPFPEKY